MHQVTQVLVPDCAPLLLTDGCREYLTALVGHYGQWLQPERRQAKGPQPQPRVLYTQGGKSYRRRRIGGVKHRVVVGSHSRISQLLTTRGWQLNTSCAERLTLDLRQPGAASGRRVTTLGKHKAGVRQQLTLFQAYHNCVLPHASLRLFLPEGETLPSQESSSVGSRGHRRWRLGAPIGSGV